MMEVVAGRQERAQVESGMRELETLLEYLVKHNEEHAGEILDLAARAKELDRGEAYEHLVRGVDLLKGSNESLRMALGALRD